MPLTWCTDDIHRHAQKTDGHPIHESFDHSQGTSDPPGPRNMPNQGGKIRHFYNFLASALAINFGAYSRYLYA